MILDFYIGLPESEDHRVAELSPFRNNYLMIILNTEQVRTNRCSKSFAE